MVFLTAAQSLFGTILLLGPHFQLRDALLLMGLFLVQFAIPVERVHVAIGWVYLTLAGTYAATYRRAMAAAGVLANLPRVVLWRRCR